jgi:hypothetical protein
MNSYGSRSVQILISSNNKMKQQQKVEWKSQESFRSKKQYIENCLVRNNLHQISLSQNQIEPNSPIKSIHSSQSLNYYYSSHSTINSIQSDSQESKKSRRVTEILRKLAKNLDSNESKESLTISLTNLSQASFQAPKNHLQSYDKNPFLISINEDVTHDTTPKNSSSDLTSTQNATLLTFIKDENNLNRINNHVDNNKKHEINTINEYRKNNTRETLEENKNDLLNTFETNKEKRKSFELEDEIINGAFAVIINFFL